MAPSAWATDLVVPTHLRATPWMAATRWTAHVLARAWATMGPTARRLVLAPRASSIITIIIISIGSRRPCPTRSCVSRRPNIRCRATTTSDSTRRRRRRTCPWPRRRRSPVRRWVADWVFIPCRTRPVRVKRRLDLMIVAPRGPQSRGRHL